MEQEQNQSQAAQSAVETKTAPAEFITLPVSLLVAAGMLSVALIYHGWAGMNRTGGGVAVEQQPAGQGGEPVAAGTLPAVGGRDVILGDANAPVTVIEYADYQCPFCARFFKETEPLIKQAYVKDGKVRLIYRNFAFLGQESTAAAEATECAKDQNKFWVYHDALYNAEHADGQENNGNLTRELFIQLAQKSGLNVGDFTSCIDSHKYQSAVAQETQAATAAGVNSTPTTFVNDQKIVGAQPFNQFKAAIDAALTQ
jgi:protein-disulfide isomerase